MRIKQVPSAYSQEQLQTYLKRVTWHGEPPRADYADLRKLMRHHLAAIPFCNTFLTYEHETPNIQPQALFTRMVGKHGGFYCFGQNLLFREILRAIGFRCFSAGARVNKESDPAKEADYGNKSHMTIFVTFDESDNNRNDEFLYLVDVGFGRMCIPQPMPIASRSAVHGLLGDYHRIGIRRHPHTSLEVEDAQVQKDGIAPAGYEYALEFQSRKPDGTAEKDWTIQYQFCTQELFTPDYDALHFYVSQCRPGLFTDNILLSRLIPSSDADPMENMGVVTIMNGSYKKRMPGKEDEKVTMQSEEERVRVIKDVFGVQNLPENSLATIKSKGLSL